MHVSVESGTLTYDLARLEQRIAWVEQIAKLDPAQWVRSLTFEELAHIAGLMASAGRFHTIHRAIYELMSREAKFALANLYQTQASDAQRGGEYLRMLVQHRMGVPLTESCYGLDPGSMIEHLEQTQPPLVEWIAERMIAILKGEEMGRVIAPEDTGETLSMRGGSWESSAKGNSQVLPEDERIHGRRHEKGGALKGSDPLSDAGSGATGKKPGPDGLVSQSDQASALQRAERTKVAASYRQKIGDVLNAAQSQVKEWLMQHKWNFAGTDVQGNADNTVGLAYEPHTDKLIVRWTDLEVTAGRTFDAAIALGASAKDAAVQVQRKVTGMLDEILRSACDIRANDEKVTQRLWLLLPEEVKEATRRLDLREHPGPQVGRISDVAWGREFKRIFSHNESTERAASELAEVTR